MLCETQGERTNTDAVGYTDETDRREERASQAEEEKGQCPYCKSCGHGQVSLQGSEDSPHEKVNNLELKAVTCRSVTVMS